MGPGRDAARRWAGAELLVASVVLLLATALFLVVRRAIGALAGPLPPLPLAVSALVVTAWAWSARALWRRLTPADAAVPTGRSHCWTSQQWHPNGPSTLADHLIRWLPSLSLLFFAIACSYPGSRLIDWLVWLPIIAADWLGPQVRIGARGIAGDSLESRPQRPISARRSSPAAEQVRPIAATGSSPAAEDQILQQLTRVRTVGGRDVIHGTLVAQFPPGARVATLHVAFCPPFERLPQVEAEAVDGPDASVKIVQVLFSGVRLDVQLLRAAERPQNVSVELLAAESSEERGDPQSGYPESESRPSVR